MIEINLLPKEYRKRTSGLSFGKAGIYSLAAAAGVVVILLCITFYQMSQLGQLETNIEKANQRASLLRSDIRVVDALIDVKGKIQSRMSAVERLDRHRSAWVRVLEDLSSNVPEFIWLSKFTEVQPPPVRKDKNKGNEEEGVESTPTPPVEVRSRPVEINGYSFTLNSLAAFMIKMMRSDYFDQVKLHDTRDTTFDEEKAYTFMLTATVHYLSDEELRKMVAQAGDESSSQSSKKSLN